MKTELKAKFLQHLNQKRSEKGFTLIELLVVIIIIGILAAIALPTFLNQTAKGKQSEAKQNVSSVNRTQTTYRAENNAFASSFDLLALGTLRGAGSYSTSNYTYTLVGGTNTASILAAQSDTALKGYAGATERYVNSTSQSVVTSVVCESLAPNPGSGTALTTFNAGSAPTCNTTNAKSIE